MSLAAALVRAHQTRTQFDYSADIGCATEAEAYGVQVEVARALGVSVAGWKVGFQDSGRIIFGAPLFASGVRVSAGQFELPRGASVKIEVEIAIRLGRELAPREKPYTRDELLDATSEIFAGIELVGSRFNNVQTIPFPPKLADNFNHAGYVTSAGTKDVRALDLSKLRSRLWIDGAVAHDAIGGHQQIDPLVPVVAWASKQQDLLGGLKAGQFITTGTLNDPPSIHRAAKIEIEIEGLGRAALDITQV